MTAGVWAQIWNRHLQITKQGYEPLDRNVPFGNVALSFRVITSRG